MLTTQELASEIKLYYAPEWDREVIVEFIRKAQLGLCLLDSREMVFWNRSDPLFPIPYMKTEAGRLEYEVGDYGDGTTGLLDSDGNEIEMEITREGVAYPIQARRIRNVFEERLTWSGPTEGVAISDQWYYGQTDAPTDRFKGIGFVPDDIQGTTNAKVTFLDDPGDTTDRYFVSFYHTPIDLQSDTIPLTIDGDTWRQALIDGAVGFIEDIENGESKRLDKFEKKWKIKFLNHVSRITKHFRSQRMKRRLAG